MNEDIFSKGIGNKELKSLEAKPVTVQGKLAESLLGKAGTKNAGKEVGKKLVLICKHPDKQEPIKISEMMLRAGNTIKASTMWINLDEEGNIQKGSHVAILLEKYKVASINEIEGKVVETELDSNKFLAIKAY